MQITYHLTNALVRHPWVSKFLPILDGMVAGVVTPAYWVRRVFRRLSSQFVLSIPQAFPGFLDLIPSMDGDRDRVLLLTGDDRSWSCTSSGTSAGAPVRASALLAPSLWCCLTSLGSRALFPALPVNTNSFMFCSESFLTIPASIRQSLGLLLSAMGSSLILEGLSTSGMVPGLSGASSDAWESALRAAEDPGKGFILPFILTIVVVIVSSRGGSKKCKKCTYSIELMFTQKNQTTFIRGSSVYRVR